MKSRRDNYGSFTDPDNPGSFNHDGWEKLGWVGSNFSCESLIDAPQLDLDPRIKRRFAVENPVFAFKIYNSSIKEATASSLEQ